MNRKIIGVTVGSSLPKPNFKQTDPTKGDYIKNKPDFDGLKNEVLAIGELVGDTKVSEQIANMSSELENKIYRQNDEPLDAEDGALWIDLDEERSHAGGECNKVYSQNDEPINAADGSLWIDLDEEGVSGGVSSGGGSINIDTTLTKSGYAADAKIVGEKLAEAKSYTDEKTSGLVSNMDVVRYTTQSLTEEQKAQARENIGVPEPLEPLIGSTDEITPFQAATALINGHNILIEYTSDDFGTILFTNFSAVSGDGAVIAASCAITMRDGSIVNASLVGYMHDNSWECTVSPLNSQKPLIGSADVITPSQVSEALMEGRDVVLAYTDSTYGTIYFSAFIKAALMGTVASSGVHDVFMNDMHMIMRFSLVGFIDNGNWDFYVSPLAKQEDVEVITPFYVSVTSSEDSTFTSETPFTEICQAYTSGHPVYAVVEETIRMPIVGCTNTEAEFVLNLGVGIARLTIRDDNTVELTQTLLASQEQLDTKLDADKLSEAVNTALTQAKTNGDFKGEQGEPGLVWKGEWSDEMEYYKGNAVSYNGTSYICTREPVPIGITPVEYELAWSILAEKGDTGVAGKNGESITITNIVESSENNGNNVVTFSDGSVLNIKNGSAGDKPVRGTDYWTVADQESIVQQVIAALGTPVFGRVDENNNIILTGALAEGTYTLKYEDAQGNVTDIGSLDMGGASYTNQIPISVGADGSVYNGTGYKTGHRLGSSSTESAVTGTNPTFITGFIPIANGQTVRLKNCYIDTDGINGFNSADTTAYYGKAANSLYISLYNSAKGVLNAIYWSNLSGSGYFADLNTDSEGKVTEFKINRDAIAYIRLTLAGDAPNAILTVDQPITD